MKARPYVIPDVMLLQSKVFGDDRGFFFESFNQARFEAAITRSVTFVQDNHSASAKHVLRGLHCQIQDRGTVRRAITILHVIPSQLLSYHAAQVKVTDVDKTRNLAKSVTTE